MLRNVFLLLFKKIAQPFRGLPIRIGIGNFYPLEFVYNLIVKKIIKPSDVAEVMGHKMFLDAKDALRLSIYGVHEPTETEILKKLIKKNDVVLDIGANIGYYTLIAAKLVGKNGKVYAFEPDTVNFEIIKKNVEINGYHNVTLIQKAVSNRTKKIKLYLCEENGADHKIYDDGTDRNSIEIESTSLDDFFRDYRGKINLIKIDAQGSEGHILEGMTSLLETNTDVKLIMEFWPSALKKSGSNPNDLLKLLKKNNLNLYKINENNKRIESVDFNFLLKLHNNESRGHPSLLCMRSKKLPSLSN